MGNVFSNVCDPQLVLPFLCGKGEFLHNLEDNLEALQKEMQGLNRMTNGLMIKVTKEGGRVVPEVSTWISKVEETEVEANRLLDDSISVINGMSMCGYLSRFSGSACRYSENVTLTLEKVKNLRSDGAFESVTLPHVKKVQPPHQPIVFQEDLLESTWDRLMKDNVGTLGLYGVGGVGKTTLLQQIYNKFPKDVFELVIFVFVGSKEVEDIQDEIGGRLGLQWGQDAKEGEKAAHIFAVLKGKIFMLLLDDVQREVNLKKIGVPRRENGCKIVFTTRSRYVSNYWADEVVEVRPLSSNQAWVLFQKAVGETALTSHPEIPKLARILADKCGGSPLTLEVVGQCMKNKMTVREWRHVIHVLVTSSHDFPDMKYAIFAHFNVQL